MNPDTLILNLLRAAPQGLSGPTLRHTLEDQGLDPLEASSAIRSALERGFIKVDGPHLHFFEVAPAPTSTTPNSTGISLDEMLSRLSPERQEMVKTRVQQLIEEIEVPAPAPSSTYLNPTGEWWLKGFSDGMAGYYYLMRLLLASEIDQANYRDGYITGETEAEVEND